MEIGEEEDPSFARIRREYPAILTTAHVAELLDLNPRTVLNMAADGRLPASRLPGSRKFHFFLEDVLKALREHMVTPGSISEDELEEAGANGTVRDMPAKSSPKKAAGSSAAASQRRSSASGQRRRG